MKKSEVEEGCRYVAKVSGTLTIVKIEKEIHRGWNAKNCATGRKILIRSGQKLRRIVLEKEFKTWYQRMKWGQGRGLPTPAIRVEEDGSLWIEKRDRSSQPTKELAG